MKTKCFSFQVFAIILVYFGLLEANEPDIYVPKTAMDIYQTEGPFQFSNSALPSGAKNANFSTTQSEYPRGLVIPYEVTEYWQTHTPEISYRIQTFQSSMDWSANDSPIKNQGQCGSCWAFAAVALIENLGSKNDLAEQIIVSCAPGDCNGGWYGYALQYIHDNGLPPEDCYSYTASNGSCSNKCSDPIFLEKVEEYDLYGRWGDSSGSTVSDLKALLQSGPVVVAMYVPTDNSFYYYNGGIYNYNGGAIPDNMGHAVLVVGYDDNEEYFKVKNSWGQSWGENGYFRISYDDVTDDVKFGGYACIASGVFTEGESNTITIENVGTSNLVINNISSNKEWLAVTPTSFSAIAPGQQQFITVSVANWNPVIPPHESGTITIQSNDLDESEVTVEINAFPDPKPMLYVDRESYQALSYAGSDVITVTNCGTGGTFNWSVSDDQDWITVSPSSGDPGDMFTISWTENIGASRGGTVTVTAEGVVGSPKLIEVTQAGAVIVSAITPNNAGNIGKVNITEITGSNFQNGATVKLTKDGQNDINGTDVVVENSNKISCSFNLTGVQTGIWSIVIMNPDGQDSGTSGSGLFQITIPAAWSMLLSINSNVRSQYRTFGGDSCATTGLDSSLDVIAPPPPEQTYYTYFAMDGFPHYLETDIQGWNRPYDAEIVWLLKVVNAEGIETTISWDPQYFPSNGSFRLEGAGSINMRIQNSVTFSGTRDIYIRYSPSIYIIYDFQDQGWYMISLPIFPGDPKVSSLFPTALGGFAYEWKEDQSGFTAVTELEAKKGYWIAIPSATTVEIFGLPLFSYTKHYSQGWYMIGSVRGGASHINPNDNPDGSVFAPAYGWTTPSGPYYDSSHLNEREGYWVAVFNNCEMTVGEGGQFLSKTTSQTSSNWAAFSALYGSEPPAPPFEINVESTMKLLPDAFWVSQNYPNPFNPETTVEFTLPNNEHTLIEVYNMRGDKIQTLLDGQKSAGRHRVVWAGKTDNGESVPSGLYLIRVTAGEFRNIQKALLVK